jgi:hypothetical protein
MKQGLEGQTRTQRQSDIKENSNVPQALPVGKWFLLHRNLLFGLVSDLASWASLSLTRIISYYFLQPKKLLLNLA